MPLLEINQIRHISASIRLDESMAAEVGHYALSSLHPQMISWTRRSTVFSRRTEISRGD